MASSAFTLLAATLLAASSTALAADPQPGEYRGLLNEKTRPIPVILQLDAAKAPGEAAGRIRFNEPWACGFELEFSGPSGGQSIYSFRGAGAGPCRPYTQGYARIQAGADGLQVELVKMDNEASGKIQLKPAATRTN